VAGVFDAEVLAVDEVEEVGGVVSGVYSVSVCVSRVAMNEECSDKLQPNGDSRRLISRVVDGVAKGCIAIENSRLEELLETIGEGFGAAC